MHDEKRSKWAKKKPQQTWRWRNELEDFRSTTNPLISDKSSDNFPEDTGGKVTDEHRFQVTSLTGHLNGSMIRFIAPVNNFLLGLFRGRGLIYELPNWLPECGEVWRRSLRFSTAEDFHLTCQQREWEREKRKFIYIYMCMYTYEWKNKLTNRAIY